MPRDLGTGGPHGIVSLKASTAALTAADTVILSALLPANSLQVGSTFRIRWYGQYAATTTQIVTFRIRLGAAGTITDTQLVSLATAAGGTASVSFHGESLVTVKAIGTSGTAAAGINYMGIPAGGVGHLSGATTAAVDTTLARYLSLTAGVAATSANLTFHHAHIERVVP